MGYSFIETFQNKISSSHLNPDENSIGFGFLKFMIMGVVIGDISKLIMIFGESIYLTDFKSYKPIYHFKNRNN